MSESVVIFAWVRRLRAYLLRFPSSFSSCFPSLCFDLKCSIEFCAVCMRVCACVSMSVCALNTWFEMVIQAVMDCASLTLLGYSAKFDGISVSLFAMLYSSHVVHAARTQPRVACRWLHTHTSISHHTSLLRVLLCLFGGLYSSWYFIYGRLVGWLACIIYIRVG